MSDRISLDLTKVDGSVEEWCVPARLSELWLQNRQLVAVSANITQLTRAGKLRLSENAFVEIPSCVLAMTQLTWLNLDGNRLAMLPREISHLRALKTLYLNNNKLVALPREIGQLDALEALSLDNNVLTSLPAELGQLTSLRLLSFARNGLTWLPVSLGRLPMAVVNLNGNPLPIDVGTDHFFNSRSKLPAIFAATTALAMIRSDATTLAIGLQDLSLPALVTLEIIDAAFPNSIPMFRKWNLITAVKHFHP